MASSESNNNNTTELKMAEKEEESKLKAKYPSIQRPGPQFLQKRLQKGQKFFDSGDYFASGKNSTLATDQQQNKNLYSLKPRLNPQPHSNLAGMKKEDKEKDLTEYVTENILAGKDSPIVPATNATGDAIPTPDCLATRKASIHVPSKLVSGGP